MSKRKMILGGIILLVYVTFFRMVFLDYPEPKMVQSTWVDGGRVPYAVMMVAVVISMLLLIIFGSSGQEKKH